MLHRMVERLVKCCLSRNGNRAGETEGDLQPSPSPQFIFDYLREIPNPNTTKLKTAQKYN